MKLRSTAIGLAVLATAVAAWAALPAAPRPAPQAPAFSLTARHGGDLVIDVSRRGRPIVTATNLIPGESASGRLSVANKSDTTLALQLKGRHIGDLPGANAGRLSRVLLVRVSEVSRTPAAVRLRRVYGGSLATFGRLRLAPLRPRAERTYVFRVLFPDGGLPTSGADGDNRYQGSAASADFVWLEAGR